MIIANWKMNGSKELIKNWIDVVSRDIEINKSKECIFCPPTCYLDFTGTLIQKISKNIKLGSQQLDSELLAPLTGGINSQMLVDIGCEFVIIGHSESINISCEKEFTLDEVRFALEKMQGVEIEDGLLTNTYPMPITAKDSDAVFVGRIRRDFSQENTLNMWVVSDNLRKGAATNTIQIAEYLIKNKLL